MPGKYINELTAAELRYECRQRGLSETGAKDDLEIRLTQHFADLNLQPNEIRFQPMESTEPTGRNLATGQVPDAGQTAHIRVESSPAQTPNINIAPSPTPTHQQAMDMIQTGRSLINEVRQAAENSVHGHSLESRLTMLEDCMARFGEDQRRIAETMRRLEMGMARQTPEQQPEGTKPTRSHHTVLSNNTEHGTRYTAAREPPSADNQHADRSVRFDDTQNLHHAPSSTHTYALQQSTLIPYDDVCAAKHSLPEFHGTTPEDPARFIHKAESIMYQTRIDRSAWTNVVAQQLKGAASTWWNTIRLLDLTWDEFRAEFLEKFDSAEIQSRLRAEIVSTRQTTTQSLTEFVTQKNQLARRVNTGLSETQLVGTIAGLTHNEYRTHIRLQRPATFADLRRVAGVLEYTPDEPATKPHPKPAFKKSSQTRPPQSTHQTRTRDGAADKPQPPNPCRYCGGPHWNSDCPGNTPRSGNGK